MNSNTNQTHSVEEDEIAQRKKFAEQAGLSVQQLKLLQSQINKRQTRNRRQPQQITSKNTVQANQIESTSNSTPKQFNAENTSSNKIMKNPKLNSKSNDKIVRKLMNTPPKSVDQFYQSFNNFYTSIFPNNDKETKFIETKKQQLFQLLNAVIFQGGIVNIISNGEKVQALQSFAVSFGLSNAEECRVFNLYKKYLLHFQYYLLENITFKQYHDPTDLFGEATFVSETQLQNFLEKTPLDPKYFQYDILVFRNGQNVLKIDSEQISLDKVREHYKNYKIDIRIQRALDYGFKPKTMTNQPYQMKIGDYTTYQKLSQQYALNEMKIDSNFIERLGKVKELDVNGITFKERVKNQEIFFGVNFDPEDGILFDYLAEKTNRTFIGFKQQFDFLSYLDHQVPGCSFPQFYFKVKGVWTGGHQENINMCAVNINHGPDASEWYTMEFKYVEQFRSQLKKQFKMDLYAGQGLWYQKINWFVEQGKYPIKKIIQKKGDIVISGPGTLHWVRSHGVALQSAWNQFPITLNSLRYAFHRQEENEKIHFIRSNVIPLKRLTLKLLNHPRPQLTTQIKALCVQKIRMWISKQEQIFESLMNEQNSQFGEEIRFERLDDLQGFCMKCKQQVFIYFVNGKSSFDVICLHCYRKEFKGKKKSKKVYIRHQISKILDLVRLTQSGQPFEEIQAFCSNYVGNVPFKCSKNERKVQKEAIFLQKVNNMNKDLNKYDTQRLDQMKQKMKNKRKASQKQDQIQNQIKQETKKEGQMELQINQRYPQKPKQPIEYRIKDNVKYIGRKPNKSGFWDFQIPQHLCTVTESNHQQLLKLIEQQQYFMRVYAKRQHRQYPFFAYQIQNRTHFKSNLQATPTKQAQFSSQSEDQKINGRKKVHKNEDYSNSQQKFAQNKKIIEKETTDKFEKDIKNQQRPKYHKIQERQQKGKRFNEKRKSMSRSISPQREKGKDRYYKRDVERERKRQKGQQRFESRNRQQNYRKQRYQDRRQKPYQKKEFRRGSNERSSSKNRYQGSKSRDNQRVESYRKGNDEQKGKYQSSYRNQYHRHERDESKSRYHQRDYSNPSRDNRNHNQGRDNNQNREQTQNRNQRYNKNQRNNKQHRNYHDHNSQHQRNYRNDRSYHKRQSDYHQRKHDEPKLKENQIKEAKKKDEVKDIQVQY